MQVDPQFCGDYVLPVSMTDLQKKVTSAIVSSNFSEILSFFDGTEASRNKNITKLQKMLSDLNLVATHPFLLLTHLQPSLSGKRAPLAIENMSGKFQSLVMLAKRFTNPNQHVAIVCEAGHTTDLVELILSDRALNVTRYSSQPTTKLYKKEITKRRGAMFHLVPSELKDLRQAVYAAFDIVVLLDNKFDVNSPYGQGLRAQLRDPVRRRPLASVVRLVALNSAQHVGLFPMLTIDEQIAATVVRKKQVGALPSAVKQFYLKDLSPLQPFINNCDGPFLLPAIYLVKQVGHKDVERALYLDDEDQYQVDFANRKVGSTNSISRRGRNGNGNGNGSEDEDSGSDESKLSGTNNSNNNNNINNNSAGITGTEGMQDSDWNNGTSSLYPISNKRRRIELEDGTIEVVKELSSTNPLSVSLLVQLNDLLTTTRLAQEEVEAHRELASNREFEIENMREQMQQLAEKVVELEKKTTASERRAEKLRTRNEKVEHELRDTELWWSKLSEELKTTDDNLERINKLTRRISELEAETTGLRASLTNEKSRYANLQSVSEASSNYASQLSKEQEALAQENAELKSQITDAPAAKELAMSQQLKAKAVEINALRAELNNLRESIKIQMSQERTTGRVDRRFGGRGGRSRQASPHLPVASA